MRTTRRRDPHHACELTRPPADGPDWRLDENDCKKLVRLAAPPLLPRSVTSVSKLDCSELSASAAPVPSAAVLDKHWMRLSTSLTSDEAVPDVPLAADAELELAAELPDVESVSDCELSAAIKFCMNA